MADLPSQQRDVPRPVPPPPSGGLSGLRVSLMPSEGESNPRADLGRAIVILVIVLLAETLVIGGVYFFLSQATVKRTDEQAQLRARIETADKDIKTKEASAKDFITFAAQAAAVKEVLQGHVYWEKFFGFLEANTTPTVRYVNFSGDAVTGQVLLDAIAISYRDMAEQIVIMRQNPGVLSVRATSASARINPVGEVTGVTFSMAIQFKPELLQGLPATQTAPAPSETSPSVPAPTSPSAPVPAQ